MLKWWLIFSQCYYENNGLSLILDDCKHLMSRFDHVQVNHIYHQANSCADALARMGAKQDSSFLFFPCSLEDIRSRLVFDGFGLYSIRLGFDLNSVC